ncbi:hypothetical protein ON010_g17529 [Phytophthora cinnamomi]|nr:hypothetical protein ON010_g17529 [Phytophthora cinnamomi]
MEQEMPHRDYVRALDWFQLASTTTSPVNKKFDTMLATGSWDKTVHTWSVEDYAASTSSSPAAHGVKMPAAPPGVPVPVA